MTAPDRAARKDCRRCGHLFDWHTDPGNACHVHACQCEAYRLGPVFPEHEKLTAVAAASQAQGELLDWLRQQGYRLMRWQEWDEPTWSDCIRCMGRSGTVQAICQNRNGGQIRSGRHRLQDTEHHEDWVPDSRSIEAILAEFHGIDLTEIDAEKRAMLDEIRAAQS